jgi:hypothetical protein
MTDRDYVGEPHKESDAKDTCGLVHDFEEDYYGHRCKKCGLFFAHGCAPWDEGQEYNDDDLLPCEDDPYEQP